MLILFRGQWQLGGTVFAIGALTFVYGVVTYRRYRAGTLLDDEPNGETDDEPADSSTDAGTDETATDAGDDRNG
jgi:hypothetical protein